MTRIASAVLALLVASPAFAESPGLTPQQIGQIFCMARVANDMGPIQGLLTPDLESALFEAMLQNDEIAAQAPDEKPPLGDGIPWQSAPDYAPFCTAGESQWMMDEARVSLRYAFPDAPEADFTDNLAFRLIDDPVAGKRVWRIDNIIFTDDTTLRDALVAAFAS